MKGIEVLIAKQVRRHCSQKVAAAPSLPRRSELFVRSRRMQGTSYTGQSPFSLYSILKNLSTFDIKRTISAGQKNLKKREGLAHKNCKTRTKLLPKSSKKRCWGEALGASIQMVMKAVSSAEHRGAGRWCCGALQFPCTIIKCAA